MIFKIALTKVSPKSARAISKSSFDSPKNEDAINVRQGALDRHAFGYNLMLLCQSQTGV